MAVRNRQREDVVATVIEVGAPLVAPWMRERARQLRDYPGRQFLWELGAILLEDAGRNPHPMARRIEKGLEDRGW